MDEMARASIEKNKCIPIYQVDAFTSRPFTGNPAAVCVLDKSPAKLLDESTMQQIAAEMNLSETAFVRPLNDDSLQDADTFSLRWFTPMVEVPLCGHATLATSHVLFHELGVLSNIIHFQTLSGELSAKKNMKNGGITLNFPLAMPTPISEDSDIRDVLEALGIQGSLEIVYSHSMNMLVILLSEEKEVRELKPDFGAMVRATINDEFQGVIVTAPGNAPYDFVSRFFGPWLGINEDPVTGSAHTVLGPYWSEKLTKKSMKAYQASERGGELEIQIVDANGGEGGGGRKKTGMRKMTGRVELTGKALTVLKGTFHL